MAWRLLGLTALSLLSASAIACSSESSRGSFDDSNPDGGTGDPGAPPGENPNVPPPAPDKPGCAQTAYTETLPTAASLADIPFSTAGAQQYLETALDRRYPIGKTLVAGGIASPVAAQVGNCFDKFTSDKTSAEGVLRDAETSVHECGHLLDLGDSSGNKSSYFITPALKFVCADGDTTSRGGKTFARSRIAKDAYQPKRPACPAGTAGEGCDTYASVYLDGSDTNSTFESGDQGYAFVLEEATQYVNSLATALAFKEVFAGSKSSERDGIMTFLWYIERYMKMAREDFPAAYTALSTDPCWRQATLSVWDRGWFYLDATKSIDNLQIEATEIEALVKDPTLLAEIDTLRNLECK